MITEIEHKRLKRQLEKQRKISRKRLAVINGLKPFVSKKVWERVMEEVV